MPDIKLIDLINSAAAKLLRIDVDVPRVNVERMLCAILHCRRVDLYVDSEKVVSKSVAQQLESMLFRRLELEPLQYILGETEFYGLPIKCDRRALIPRPETEFVVSKTIGLLQDKDQAYVLDLACGTGCIGVAVAVNLPQAQVTFTDISEDALSLAQENARLHNLTARVALRAGDLFSSVRGGGVMFDAVVCNPPYIKSGDWELLHRQIRDYEPRRALLAGDDGLDFIRQMLAEVGEVLVPGGYCVFEMGQGQADEVRRVVSATKGIEIVETLQDYSAIERVAVVQRR
jgi:release factor glutamine methyltransferase